VHFDFSISAGQIGLLLTLITLIWRIEVFSSWLLFEHELLIIWYCKEHNIDPKDLITRKMKKGLFSLFKTPTE
jgi:hypothetical protein